MHVFKIWVQANNEVSSQDSVKNNIELYTQNYMQVLKNCFSIIVGIRGRQ